MNVAGLIRFSALILFSNNLLAAVSVYNIAVAEDGRYQVNFEQFQGLESPVYSAGLRLYEQGKPVPFMTNDGGDGLFNRGDSVQFVGRRLAGSRSWYNENSKHNVYQLRVADGPQYPPVAQPQTVKGDILQHLEQDKLRVALPRAKLPRQVERWYWQRITSLVGDGFRQRLSWDEPPEIIRVALTGLSYDQHATAAGLPQHRAVIYLDGKPVAESEWNGQDSVTVEFSTGSLDFLASEGALLEVHVPLRNIPGTGQNLVDAVLLNWLELEYSSLPQWVDTIPSRNGKRWLKVAPGLLAPSWVALAPQKAGLTGTERQVDYIMVSHSSLIDALGPLVDFHRASGLTVEVVDVGAVYNEFSHGVASPDAIRSFISHASRHWQKPAPRMVLLAGDASWGRESDVVPSRNLVPTFQALVGGHFAASDNGLVSVHGDDWRPDLAVGRLPAGNAEELSVMVSKLLRQAKTSSDAEWRTRTAWIAGAEPRFKDISDAVSDLVEEHGLSKTRVYPDASLSRVDQSRVMDVFNEGHALVHFLGHGGRSVWRTGPQDLQGATDLFTLKTVQSLTPGHPLPLVLSMTCSSGPFDHPSVSSLAESLLVAPERGAIGIVAASWRIPASQRFSSALIASLLQPKKTIGAAVLEAKRAERRRNLVEAYNLLGDPAMVLDLGDRQ